jgi:hypothetical protein
MEARVVIMSNSEERSIIYSVVAASGLGIALYAGWTAAFTSVLQIAAVLELVYLGRL